MKNEEIIVLGLAGVAVWLILQSQKPKAAGGVTSNANKRTEEIFDQWGATFNNGWRYFTDGTAIDPQGRYWKDGQVIWTPAK